jgi:hypothetical protein
VSADASRYEEGLKLGCSAGGRPSVGVGGKAKHMRFAGSSDDGEGEGEAEDGARLAAFKSLAYGAGGEDDDDADDGLIGARGALPAAAAASAPRAVFYTRVLGVVAEYGEFDFYKEAIQGDTLRVGRLFAAAAAAAGRGGAPCVVQATLRGATLCRLLRSRAVVAIALVDLNYLAPSRQQGGGGAKAAATLAAAASSSLAASTSAPPPKPKAYRGHYIVLCGHLAASDEVVYRDPEGPPGHVGFVTSRQLDKARGAWGTDEDLILVSVPT